MKTRSELLRLLDLKEIRRYAVVRAFRHFCPRCGRLTWDRRLCAACRREVALQRLTR